MEVLGTFLIEILLPVIFWQRKLNVLREIKFDFPPPILNVLLFIFLIFFICLKIISQTSSI